MTRERLQYLSLCVTDMRATVGALPASFDSVEAFCAAFDEMRFVRNLGEELACAIDQDAVPRSGGQRDEHDTGKQGMQTDVTTELETINAALTDVRAALGKLPQRFDSVEQFNGQWSRLYRVFNAADKLSTLLAYAPPSESIE